jgi:hypothetical protein
VAAEKTDITPIRAGQLPTVDEDLALIHRFQAGDKAAETEIVKRMKQDKPWGEGVAQGASTLRDEWLNYANSHGFTHEVLTVRARMMKRDLIGDDPTVLESLLAERIVICHIALERAESEYIQRIQQDGTFKRGLFYEHLMDRANRRYFHAVKALAQVRRLQLPALAQLNVAANQVNVANVTDSINDGGQSDVA